MLREDLEHPAYSVQKYYERGVIIDYDIDEANRRVVVYVRVTDPDVVRRIESGELQYVSPSVVPVGSEYVRTEGGREILDRTHPLHLCIVGSPAYREEAVMSHMCSGDGQACYSRLKAMTASAARIAGTDGCVSRKIGIIRRERPGISAGQAAAIAYSYCRKDAGTSEGIPALEQVPLIRKIRAARDRVASYIGWIESGADYPVHEGREGYWITARDMDVFVARHQKIAEAMREQCGCDRAAAETERDGVPGKYRKIRGRDVFLPEGGEDEAVKEVYDELKSKDDGKPGDDSGKDDRKKDEGGGDKPRKDGPPRKDRTVDVQQRNVKYAAKALKELDTGAASKLYVRTLTGNKIGEYNPATNSVSIDESKMRKSVSSYVRRDMGNRYKEYKDLDAKELGDVMQTRIDKLMAHAARYTARHELAHADFQTWPVEQQLELADRLVADDVKALTYYSLGYQESSREAIEQYREYKNIVRVRAVRILEAAKAEKARYEALIPEKTEKLKSLKGATRVQKEDELEQGKYILKSYTEQINAIEKHLKEGWTSSGSDTRSIPLNAIELKKYRGYANEQHSEYMAYMAEGQSEYKTVSAKSAEQFKKAYEAVRGKKPDPKNDA